MNRVQLDQGLAPRAAALLRERGRVCVTLDHDFHVHMALASHGRPSLVLLRVQGPDAQGQADLIQSVCLRCETALVEGAAVSADREGIRVRRLPLR